MDRIDVPVVAGDTPPASVFDLMAAAGVHGAMVAFPGRAPAVVTNRQVDEAIERGLASVGQIPRRPLHVVDADLQDADWEKALDAAGATFGIVVEQGTLNPVPGTMVKIVTRHEDEIRYAGEICRCSLNRHRAQKGQPCPYCGSDVICA